MPLENRRGHSFTYSSWNGTGISKCSRGLTEDCESSVIIGRPLLEGLGINNKQMIEAACDQHGGVVDTGKLNQENDGEFSKNSYSSVALLENDIYHSAGGCEGDGLEEQDVYIDLGEDSEEHSSTKLRNEFEKLRKTDCQRERSNEIDIYF